MTEPVNHNPTPKAQFMEHGDWVTEHRRWMEHPAIERGLHYALLEYQRLVLESLPPDMNQSVASSFKLKGALEFIHTLKTLGDKPTIKTPILPPANLNPRA